MNRITGALALTAMVAGAAVGCTPAKNGAADKVVASSPTPQQTRDNLRFWLRAGGDKLAVDLQGDLVATADGSWQKNPFLTKVVADNLTRDVVAARAFQPVPDDRAQGYWVSLLSDTQLAGSYMEAVGGGYQKQGDPKQVQRAAAVLKLASRDLAQFQAREYQINTARGTR